MEFDKISRTMQEAASHVSTHAAKLANFLVPPGSEQRRIMRAVHETMIKPAIEDATRVAHAVSGVIKAVVGIHIITPFIVIGTIVREGALLTLRMAKESPDSDAKREDTLALIADVATELRKLPIQLLKSAWHDFGIAAYGEKQMRQLEQS